MSRQKDTTEKKTIEVPVYFCPHCGELLPEDLVQYITSQYESMKSVKYWSDEENRLQQAAKAKARELFKLGVKARLKKAEEKKAERERIREEERQARELRGKPVGIAITEEERERRRNLGKLMHEARRKKSQERRESSSEDERDAGRHHIDAKIRNILQKLYDDNKGVFSTAPSGVVLFVGRKTMNTLYFESADELASIFMQKKLFADKRWTVRPFEMEDGTTLYSFHIETYANPQRNKLVAVIAHVDVSGMKNPNLQ